MPGTSTHSEESQEHAISLEELYNETDDYREENPPSNNNKKDEGDEEDEGNEGDNNKPNNEKGDEGNEGNEGKSKDNNLDTEENKSKILNLFQQFSNNDAELNETQQKTKEKLLEKSKGEAFDEEGNIVDSEGNIIKSFEDVYKDLINTPTNLDADGNQVNDKGEIIKTALELAAEKSYVNKLHLNSDFEFTDDEGKPKIYEDSEEGLNEYVQDLADARFSKSKEAFINQNQEAINIAKHLALGGDISTYNTDTDWDKLDAKSLSKEEKLSYIKKSFNVAGFSEERIKGLIELINTGNTVDAEFLKAKEHLKQNEQDVKDAREQAYNKKIAEETARAEAHWNNVKNIIDNDKVAIVNIPKKEKEAFYKYVSEAVDDNGNSQDNIEASKLSTEQKLALSYIRFKKLDLKELVKQEVQNTKVESLTDLVLRSSNVKNTSTSKSSAGNSSNNDNPDVIAISDLLD